MFAYIISALVLFMFCCMLFDAKTDYLSSSEGNDKNNEVTLEEEWGSLQKANNIFYILGGTKNVFTD